MKNKEIEVKTVKITPTIAKILAKRIIKEISNTKAEKFKEIQKLISKELQGSSEYKRVLIINKEIEKLNKTIKTKLSKYVEKMNNYDNFFAKLRTDLTISQYHLKGYYENLSEENIKNDILMEATFGNAKSAEEIVQNYIKKYTK